MHKQHHINKNCINIIDKAFVLPHYQCCSVWQFGSSRNCDNLESVNKCVLHTVFNDRESTNHQLLDRVANTPLYNSGGTKYVNYYFIDVYTTIIIIIIGISSTLRNY